MKLAAKILAIVLLSIPAFGQGAFTTVFNTGSVPSGWHVDTGNAPGNISGVNVGTFAANHCLFNQGYADLMLTQSGGNPVTSIGCELSTNAAYGYGTYTVVARAASNATTPTGSGSAFSGSDSSPMFTYQGSPVPSATEIDSPEIEGQFPNTLEWTNWKTENAKQFTSTTLTNPQAAFHTYKFIWQPGRIDYYVDGNLVTTHTLNIPTLPAPILTSLWGTNSSSFGGFASVGVIRHQYVQQISFAPLTVQDCTAPPGGWSISNQPPVGCRPYSSGLFTKQLPGAGSGGPMTHLAPSSDAIASSYLGYDSSFAGTGTGAVATTGNDGTQAQPFYYGRASDPIYAVSNTCTHPGSTAANNPTGTFWHIPNRAVYAGGQSDMFFTVWDQTNNMVLSTYTSGGLSGNGGVSAQPLALQSCSATTVGSACSMFRMGFCNMANYTTAPGYAAGNGAGDSLGNAPSALYIRANEWMQSDTHGITHALYLNTNCEASSTPVFPGVSSAFVCPSPNSATQPKHGALFFLDYTDAQIASFTGLQPWQRSILWTMAHYGGYVGDTDGSSTPKIVPNRYEAGEAYTLAGLTNPLYAWFDSQGLSHHTDGTSQAYFLPYWAGVPSVTGPNCTTTPCGINRHAHIADPCVAQALAGVTSTCGAAPPPPPPPPSSNFYVSVLTGNDANNGTTPATAWKTLQKAIAAFTLGTSGAVIHAAQGTYSYPGGQGCFQNEAPSLCISRGGNSATQPLIIQCDSPWTVPSSPTNGCKILSTGGTIISLGQANFVTIRGFEFFGSNSDIGVIAGCDGQNPTVATGTCPAGNGLVVEKNYFHDMGQVDGCPSTGVVQAGPSHGSSATYSVPPVLRWNRFQHIGNLALARKNGGSCNQYHASYLSTPGAVVEGNLFLDVVSFSVHAYSYPCSGIIANNTIVRDGASGVTYSGGDCPATGRSAGKGSLVNNIILDSGQGALSFNSDGSCTTGTPNLLSHNITGGNPLGLILIGGNSGTVACLQSVGNTTSATGSQLFVNYLGSSSTANGNDDLHLKSTSPAIGFGTTTCVTGVASCTPTTDLDGNAMSNPLPAGAYTSGGTPPPPPPPVNQYYVATTGNDSNNGTSPSTPWLTINHADGALVPSTTSPTVVNVACGNYSSAVTTAHDGTPTNHIIWLAATRGCAHIVNQNWQITGDFVDVNGFDITNPGAGGYAFNVVGLGDSVLNNYLHDFTTGACGLYGVINIFNGSTAANGVGALIQGNVIRHAGNYSFGANSCVTLHGIYDGSAGTIAYDNVISGVTGWGIKSNMEPGECGPRVYANNTIFNNGGGFLATEFNDSGFTCKWSKISLINNVIVMNGVDTPGGGRFGVNYYHVTAQDSLSSHNLIYGNQPEDMAHHDVACGTSASGATPVHGIPITGTDADGDAGGCPADSPQTDSGGTGSTFAAFHVDTPTSPDGSYDVNHYKLAITSNAIGNGTRSCALGGLSPCSPGFDYAGTLFSNPMTIGAFTFGTSTAAPIITVAPSTWDFGTVNVGTPVTKDFTLTNIGGADAIIGTVDFLTSSWDLIATGLGVTTYTDSGVTNGATYTYAVTAVGPGGTTTTTNNIDEYPDTGGTTNCTTANWCWQHDVDTPGSSSGTSAIVASPSLDGNSRQMVPSWSLGGGERFSINTGPTRLDPDSANWVLDFQFYPTNLAHITHLEFDLNQVMNNGDTNIFGTQCDMSTGFWDFTTKVSGSPHWNTSTATCPRSVWNLNAWNHVVIAFHRSIDGTVTTYDSVSVNGVGQSFGSASGPSNFSLGWTPIGEQVINVQLDGDSTTAVTTVYVDEMKIVGSSGSSESTKSAPSTVIIPGSGTHSVLLNWSPATGATSYNVYRMLASGSLDYSETDDCSTVSVNATCTMTVTFDPTQFGQRATVMRVPNNSSVNPFLVPLTGFGGSVTPPPPGGLNILVVRGYYQFVH